MAIVHLYLDTRTRKKDGRFPFKAVISQHGKSAMISLDASVEQQHWDATKRKVIILPNKTQLNQYLSRRIVEIEDVIHQLQTEGKLHGKTAQQIKELVLQVIEPDTAPKTGQFLEFFDKCISQKIPQTADTYLSAKKWILKYDAAADRKDFDDISKYWIEGLHAFMTEEIADNTAVTYMRNIKAVFNAAMDEELTTHDPFRKLNYKMTATRKRNLSVDNLNKLFNMPVNKKLQRYVDTFKLMFLLIGINGVDLCMLKPEDYQEGRIRYIRSKTGKQYDIKVEPEAAAIIEKYKGKEHLLSFCDSTSVDSFMACMNRVLKANMDKTTSYYCRHSWATIAANELDIPKETIARALGHGKASVTDVYIDFDQKKVDDANRKVIDFVLYGKRTSPSFT